MADNLTLNAGAGGATLATDDAGAGGHVQVVKLAVSTNGSATALTADNTNGLLVDVSRVQGNVTVVGAAADGAAAAGNPVLVAGFDGTNAQSISVTSGGLVQVHDAGGSITVDNGGTFATQVDGAALTALQLIDDPVATLGTTTYTETTTKGMIVGAVRRDADTTLVDTTNEIGPLQMDANGRLKVEAFSGETLPVSLASVPSHAVTNAGTFAVQVDGNALTALQLIDDAVFTDDAAFTPGTSKGFAVGFQADETAADSVDEGDFGVPRMTLDRQIRVVNVPESNSIRAGSATRTPAFASIAAASSGNNTLVTNSNGGLKIRVFSMALIAAGTVSLYFTGDNAGTVVFGGSTNKIALVANTGFVLPFNPLGWFECAADTDLVVNLSGAIAVSGGLVYAEV